MIRDSIIKRFQELIETSKEPDLNKTRITYRDSKLVLTVEELQDFNQWKMSSLSLLNKTFSNESDHYRSFFLELPTNFDLTNSIDQGGLSPHEYNRKMAVLRGILMSALNEVKSGFLYEIIHILSAEFFDNILDQSKELLNKGYKDPAAILGRVIIENTLKDLCKRNNIQLNEGEMASSLKEKLKNNNAFTLPQFKVCRTYIEIGNDAAHGNFDKYSQDDIKKMFEYIENSLLII